jgi:hypothetical protein
MAFGIVLDIKAMLNDGYYPVILMLLLEECFRRDPRLLELCLEWLRTSKLATMASSIYHFIGLTLANYSWPTELQHRTLLDNSPYAKRIAEAVKTLEAIPPKDRGNAKLLPPRIVLLGNPGCGKSSLMYALAQIPIHLLPTEDDDLPLPTRCPVQLNLRRTRGESWWSEVWIYPSPWPWRTYKFARTNERQELPRLIRSAQAELLDRAGPGKHIGVTEGRAIMVDIWGAETDFNILEVPGIDKVQLSDPPVGVTDILGERCIY